MTNKSLTLGVGNILTAGSTGGAICYVKDNAKDCELLNESSSQIINNDVNVIKNIEKIDKSPSINVNINKIDVDENNGKNSQILNESYDKKDTNQLNKISNKINKDPIESCTKSSDDLSFLITECYNGYHRVLLSDDVSSFITEPYWAYNPNIDSIPIDDRGLSLTKSIQKFNDDDNDDHKLKPSL